MSGGWTVPEGEVNLCLNGQTIDGSIKIGSGASLTLTDCSSDNSGRIQGGVTVNGGKFELYSGTITGGLQVGIKGGSYQTGSAFTMYGGAITGNRTDSGAGGGVFLCRHDVIISTRRASPCTAEQFPTTPQAHPTAVAAAYMWVRSAASPWTAEPSPATQPPTAAAGSISTLTPADVSISNATITGNKASATGNTSYGHGGGIYSQRGVTVKNVTITGNNSTFEGGGIYGKGAITLTDATVTDNNRYDVYYGGQENSAPKLTVSGSVKAGYYANEAWKLPILVSGELSKEFGHPCGRA